MPSRDDSPRARATRIAAALADLLDGLPPESSRRVGGDPYRGAHVPTSRADRVRVTCPGCRGPMSLVHERGVEIHRCAGCGGLWLGPGDLDALVVEPATARPELGELREVMRGIAPPVGDVLYRRCPSCNEPMHRRNYGSHSGVIVDECAGHGLYLDPRELEAIETYVHMGGLELERRRAVERRQDESHRRESAARSAGESRRRTSHREPRWEFLAAFLDGLFGGW